MTCLLQFVLHIGRLIFSYGETAFMLNFFANGKSSLRFIYLARSLIISTGTEGVLTVPVMGSFFRNQTFPENWHRRNSTATFGDINDSVIPLLSAHPIPAGVNDANGNYVLDPVPQVRDPSS